MFAVRFLLVLMFLCSALPAHCGVPQAPVAHDFDMDLVTARDNAQLTPRAALQALNALQDGRQGPDLARVLVETSLAYARLGDKDAAADAAARAERLARDARDDALLAQALLARASITSSLDHDLDTARPLIAQAARLADQSHDPALLARVAMARALLADEEGHGADGLRIATEAVASARAGDDTYLLSMALRLRARLLAAESRYVEALACSDELNAIAKASKQRTRSAQARLTEYGIAAQAGQVKRAETALQKAIDLLHEMKAQESLVVPMVNLAELYTQQMRYGEAARTSQAALRIAHELGDERAVKLASFQLGIANIHFRDIAHGRRMVEDALSGLEGDDRYLPMLLEYGHALGKVGEGDGALTIYRKAGAVSRADWRKGRQLTSQLSYLALQRAYDEERKKSELAALRHDSELKAAELKNERRLTTSWVLLSAVTLMGAIAIAMLYRRVASANRLLQVKNEELFRQSTRDSLTGLFNRHYFYEHVVPDLVAAAGTPGLERRANPGGAGGGAVRGAVRGVYLLLDVDRFKSINDTHGHGAGDVVLKTVAARLAATLREQDVLIRWGGEEFLAWLPDVASDEARRVCARLLAAISSTPIAIEGHELAVTISIGFCPTSGPDAAATEMGWEQLVHLADLCLYLAKTAGRNQAFGIDDASTLTPSVFAAADSDLRQASSDGLVELVNVKTPASTA